MINHDYLVDTSWCDSGGYCDFLPIRGQQNLGFKSFKTKSRAKKSLINQLILNKFDLAPSIFTPLCKIAYWYDPELLKTWTPSDTVTSWGYVTEKAILIDCEDNAPPYLHKIQKLVENIWDKTGLKFWDCHETNVGYIKRGRRKKLTCIDTGYESFEGYSNAWGHEEPGPKCPYCEKYNCKCPTVYD